MTYAVVRLATNKEAMNARAVEVRPSPIPTVMELACCSVGAGNRLPRFDDAGWTDKQAGRLSSKTASVSG